MGDRAPAMEEVDFAALTAPPVREYAEAHFRLYRVWANVSSGMDRDQVLELMGSGGLVGDSGDKVLFATGEEAKRWLSDVWPSLACGSSLEFPEFIALSARLGSLPLRGASTQTGAEMSLSGSQFASTAD